MSECTNFYSLFCAYARNVFSSTPALIDFKKIADRKGKAIFVSPCFSTVGSWSRSLCLTSSNAATSKVRHAHDDETDRSPLRVPISFLFRCLRTGLLFSTDGDDHRRAGAVFEHRLVRQRYRRRNRELLRRHGRLGVHQRYDGTRGDLRVRRGVGERR